MTQAEFRKYWRPFRAKFEHKFPNAGAFRMFHASRYAASLLGLDYPESGHWGKICLTDDLKHKLALLAGPHGEVIAKIWKIQRSMDDRKETNRAVL